VKVIGHKSEDEHLVILLNSFKRAFGEVLTFSDSINNASIANDLWHADFVLVSHGIEADPIFNYGNQTALELFELNFSQFSQLPSRKSAAEISQAERDQLLAEVTEYGCIDNYTGIRVSSTGRRFFIENAKVWNLYDENSVYYGQAAVFKSWKHL
jgi:hypothetical protein